MSFMLALLLMPQEPASLPSPHKIGQALADIWYQQEIMEARRYKPLRIFEPVVKTRYPVVRNVNCIPAVVPEKWRNPKFYAPEFIFGGGVQHATRCSYEYILIPAGIKKTWEYQGPRQKAPPVISNKQQRRLDKKKWKSETNVILMAERGACALMGRTPPKELDCGEYWFFDTYNEIL
jgi:hypothetical protein